MDTSTDNRTVHIVVVFLGLAVLLGIGAIAWLVDHGKDAALVAALTGGALGSLGTLLASTRTVNIDDVAERARADTLAEVESLGENLYGQGD